MTATVALVRAANTRLSEADATAALSTYSAIAQARLDNDNPGLSTTLYDWCHALMICHLLASANPATGLKGYSNGDYSESRNPGQTVWMLQYNQVLDDFQADEAEGVEEVERADANMPEMHLDQSDIPTYYTEGL